MQLPAADAHTLTLTGVFWGRLGFDERSILQWSQIQQLDITEVASLRFLYGFLWIPMDFLSIPMDSFGFQAMKLKEKMAESCFDMSLYLVMLQFTRELDRSR